MFLVIGAFLGFIMFTFTFIASKKNGKYYLAPIVTFLMSIAITTYGLFFVGGFEGMAYGILAAEFLLISIIGTLLLPLLTRKKASGQLNQVDKISLAILPLLFFLTIGAVVYFDKGYWLIQEGVTNGEVQGYKTSTGMEGVEEISLILGKDFVGKKIEVKKVSRSGPTIITVKITEDGDTTMSPYITIGLDEIKDPLQIQTTDGVIFEPIMAN